MSYPTTNMFVRLVRQAYKDKQTEFIMDAIYPPEQYNLYQKRDESKEGIQLIYYCPNPDSAHLICVRFTPSNHPKQQEAKVTIYDSAYYDGQIVHSHVLTVLSILYPCVKEENVRFAVPGTRQYGPHSCGYFAVAFATALLFGVDPEKLKLKVYSFGDEVFFFKPHLDQIIRQQRITPFPTVSLYMSNEVVV